MDNPLCLQAEQDNGLQLRELEISMSPGAHEPFRPAGDDLREHNQIQICRSEHPVQVVGLAEGVWELAGELF